MKVQQSSDGGETWLDSTITSVFDGPGENYTGTTTLTETSTAVRVGGLTSGTSYDFKLVGTDEGKEIESNTVRTTY
ncbi:hypothetical protein [Planococcus ruber]|uniref:hypothetical protein n=1 Tax=Planococcus ruber TaxID=2027871 RepID=UPI001FED5E90|nr:hypothetical protein [Planococcus ruber]MCJ1908241.1 hypothetical protein [Planococcus ruber]